MARLSSQRTEVRQRVLWGWVIEVLERRRQRVLEYRISLQLLFKNLIMFGAWCMSLRYSGGGCKKSRKHFHRIQKKLTTIKFFNNTRLSIELK